MHAQAALAEIVTTMGWQLITEACVAIPVARKGVVLSGELAPEFATPLRQALVALTLAAAGCAGRAGK